MSDEYTEKYLEGRYEQYLDQGYSPKDSEIMAYEDLEHDSYDYVPEQEDETNEQLWYDGNNYSQFIGNQYNIIYININ